MSTDTANLLREHVKATAELLTNEKPDRKEGNDDDASVHDDHRNASSRKA